MTRNFGRPLLLLVCLLMSVSGCGKAATSHVAKSSPPVLPSEYVNLAEVLSLELKESRGSFQEDNLIDNIPLLMAYTPAFKTIDVRASELSLLIDRADTAIQEVGERLRRLADHPGPPDVWSQTIATIIGGFYTGYTGDLAGLEPGLGAIAENSSHMESLRKELAGILRSSNELHECRLRLLRIASQYAATPSESDHRITIDIDEAWGPLEKFDWLTFHNSSREDLSNCTFQVELSGANGALRQNVHFVKEWPANISLHARYKPGVGDGGLLFGIPSDSFQTTVPQIQKAVVTIWSPKYSARIEYFYQGVERDRDIARRCDGLSFSGQFHPFVDGYLWDTQPGASFTLNSQDILPAHEAEITFRNSSSAESITAPHDSWAGETTKTFRTSPGQLLFVPSHVDLHLTFPNSNFRYVTTLSVQTL